MPAPIVAQMSTNDYTIPITESLLKRLREIAKEYGLSMDDVVQIAVAQWLEKHNDSKGREKHPVNPSVPAKYALPQNDKPPHVRVTPKTMKIPPAIVLPPSGKKKKNG